MAPPPPPLTPTADEARGLAARELAQAAYRTREPGVLEQLGRWLLERLDDLVGLLTAQRAGGAGGVLVVLALVVVVVVVVRRRLGRAARTAHAGAASLDDTGLTAADHRRRAEDHADDGRFDDAVREWMRALVRGLEERDVLAGRPGRTAGEAAREASAVLPGAADALADAARCFDETVYGGRSADAGSVARMRAADRAVGEQRVAAG
ncbi:DUF4129 domain-containing protein [Actinomycetospora termitidis]|uniref:DUF4129 domain-containing protein n=1 Tax=Actinomycetospora termitidis TaxID=3053470 RepID=A0ABT7ME02_9PSEU|nr:DUF4129 domain-containing protein [Actinomycetospora sp. Odt1-22]MDL5158102.1 DUF4129 domain-containing protein [Actinomycetospora sp. Odt1-22]